jgi:Ser-tRNA(Ala) deacylase AlaX
VTQTTVTRKLFWTEPYRRDCEAVVQGVVGDAVTLDQTVFYALSGGQESDHGRIGGHEVLEARKDGAGITYTLPPGHGLKPGDRVPVQVDWLRRYRLMRLHFAAELVLELVYRAQPGIQKIGAHIAEDKARVDFASNRNISVLFPDILSSARGIVMADRPIVSAFSDEAAGRRYWEVEGFARVACGGTHLRRTGEVGAMRLKRRNIGAGKERIEITLDAPPDLQGASS